VIGGVSQAGIGVYQSKHWYTIGVPNTCPAKHFFFHFCFHTVQYLYIPKGVGQLQSVERGGSFISGFFSSSYLVSTTKRLLESSLI